MADDPAGGASQELQPAWYVAVGSEVYGPADADTLREWSAAGRLPPGGQVCPVGGSTWVLPGGVPELRDLAAPPPPPAAYARPAPPPAPLPRGLSPCPHCGGPVTNTAAYDGWPRGLFQRALKPEFGCQACGSPVAYQQLTPSAQAAVTRTLRRAFAGWLVLVIFVILGIASPFLAAPSYR